MTKLQKLCGMLEKCYYDGKLPKCCTPADVSTLLYCYNELKEKKHPEFISLPVKNVLENIGFMTAPKGIGWTVIS